MFFEGSEKKFEAIVSDEFRPLNKKFSYEFWEALVRACDASILSTIQNEQLSAFLLSESSLFVWDDRILMLTCGNTKLVRSIELFVKELGEGAFESLIFQRKNEYEPGLQSSSFKEDIKEIQESLPGKSYRFGKIHGHYNLLFHLDKSYQSDQDDTTSELLMYDISKEASHLLTSELSTKEEIRKFFDLEKLLPDFQIDDFVFKPFGYSLNAIGGSDYYTIHVTPQLTSPYVSFESNLDLSKSSMEVFHHLIRIFSPGSFDLVTFNCSGEVNFGSEYWQTCHFKEKLSCGYGVDFRYFYRQMKEIEKPFLLEDY